MFKTLGSDAEQGALARRQLAAVPAIAFYVMGPVLPAAKGNYWVTADDFPVATPTAFYLAPNQTLVTTSPSQPGAAGFVYDPRSPCPTLGGNNLLLPQCGPWDQATLERRADVIHFTTAPLATDKIIVGHMFANLYVSSNCTDTDFVVKVIDRFPNGTSLLIQDGIARMRWRNGGATPQLLTPGQTYSVTVRETTNQKKKKKKKKKTEEERKKKRKKEEQQKRIH